MAELTVAGNVLGSASEPGEGACLVITQIFAQKAHFFVATRLRSMRISRRNLGNDKGACEGRYDKTRSADSARPAESDDLENCCLSSDDDLHLLGFEAGGHCRSPSEDRTTIWQ